MMVGGHPPYMVADSYPRVVRLDELSFSEKVKKQIRLLGPNLTLVQYQEIIEKASEPISLS
jgi:hypothetical protein